jgi:RNA polymerase sigma-70 factor (ECF subfamily)
MLGNDADAVDATQDTLVAALRALDRFDGRSSFGTWIYRIATNTCIDEMRRRRRRPVTGVAADFADLSDDISFGAPGLFVEPASRGNDPADIVAARIDIDVALASLPVAFRTAVVLRDVCDLPYDEIAEILGVPVGTVRSRIARARSALAATWQAQDTAQDTAPDAAPGAAPDTGRDAPSTAPARRVPGNGSDLRDVRTTDEQRGSDPLTERSQEEERTQ